MSNYIYFNCSVEECENTDFVYVGNHYSDNDEFFDVGGQTIITPCLEHSKTASKNERI